MSTRAQSLLAYATAWRQFPRSLDAPHWRAMAAQYARDLIGRGC
ncbi:hypothetical protein [Caldimonas sp. KR1-144]